MQILNIKDVIGGKLKDARLLLGLSQGEAATFSGLSQRDVSQLETGKKEFVPSEYIQFLNNRGIDISTIYDPSQQVKLKEKSTPNSTPVSAPITSKAAVETPQKGKNKASGAPILVTVDNSGRENIVLVDTQAAAGYIRNINDVELYRELPSFSLPSNILRNGTFRAFRVRGDSMAPKISNADIVIGQLLLDWAAQIKDGRIYIVVTTDDIVVKRVINRIEERGTLLLKSDNFAYSPYSLSGESIQQVFEWKCTISFDGSNPFFDIIQWNQRLENSLVDLTEELKELKRKKRS